MDEAGYVVYPNTMLPPPGFKWCGGAPPSQEAKLLQANARILSHSLYLPPASQPQDLTPQLSAIEHQISETESDEQEERIRLPRAMLLFPTKTIEKRRLPTTCFVM